MNENMNENLNQNLNTGKPKKGKNILLIVLIVLVLGLAGYITYDKINAASVTKQEQKETDKLKTQVKTLNTKNKKLVQEAKVQEQALQQAQQQVQQQAQPQESKNETPTNFINAIYFGEKEGTTNTNIGSYNFHVSEFLILFNDGTYNEIFLSSESNSGTYTINGNNLVLHIPADERRDGGDVTYQISQDRTQIQTNQGLTLKKQ